MCQFSLGSPSYDNINFEPHLGDPHPLSMEQLDRLGEAAAEVVFEYRRRSSGEYGPTWREVGDEIGLTVVGQNRVLPQLRARGWLEYTSASRSLDVGPRYLTGNYSGLWCCAAAGLTVGRLLV